MLGQLSPSTGYRRLAFVRNTSKVLSYLPYHHRFAQWHPVPISSWCCCRKARSVGLDRTTRRAPTCQVRRCRPILRFWRRCETSEERSYRAHLLGGRSNQSVVSSAVWEYHFVVLHCG